MRQAADGWHAVMHLHGVEHRIWFKEAPILAAAYAVELPLDRDFEFRVDAGRRLWRGLNGRPQGVPLHALSAYRRRRLALALRALDGRMDGATYREIAEAPAPRPPHSRAGLENARCPQSDHPPGQDWFRVGAGWLPRLAKTSLKKEIARSLGVSKLHPPIFGIPLRGSSPSWLPSTRH